MRYLEKRDGNKIINKNSNIKKQIMDFKSFSVDFSDKDNNINVNVKKTNQSENNSLYFEMAKGIASSLSTKIKLLIAFAIICLFTGAVMYAYWIYLLIDKLI